MRSRKLLALLFCLITFPAIAGYMTLLGAGVGSIAPVVSWVSGTDAFPSTLSFSRTSNATMFDSTGKLTYAPNNLLLNTETLSTQSVNLAANTNYILTYYGTGSVALSGTASGTPSGTNPSYVKFASSGAGSATFTVTGSVTNASLAAVTYETTPRAADQVITTAAAYYGPRVDYDPNTLAVKGLLIEEARTNLVVNSNQFASWTISGGSSVATNSNTQIDGTTNGNTFSLVAGVSGHQIYKSYTGTAVAYTNSVYVKAGTSSWLGMWFVSTAQADGAFFNLSNGTIGTVAAGTTAAIQSIGNGWYRCSITKTLTAATYYNGLEVHTADNQAYNFNAAGTESLYLFGAQGELGSFATSYIPTAAASVTRAADVVQFTGAALTAASGSAATLISEWDAINASLVVSAPTQFGTTGGYPLLRINNATTLLAMSTAGNSASLTVASGTWNANFRVGLAYNSSGFTLAANGASASSAAAFTSPSTVYVGNLNGVENYSGNHHLRSFAIYNQRLSDATLQAKSVVGASYAANDNGARFANNDNLPVHWRIAL